jgi:S-DNA-T family DNA segregation ATPase FtsK/SpoIIIE
MEERYQLFAESGVADLEALREHSGRVLPRIVCFCDEYGNLVAQKRSREAIEHSINQLGAKARAAGIHVILATQDPRAQILSPILKTNLGGRVCLRTTSSIQSRLMLEQNGAESLLGYGDLFFKVVGEPIRLQAPLLEDSARKELFRARAFQGLP